MLGLSFGHLLIIAVVVLLFGRKRLPEVGSALGRGISAFRKSLAAKPDKKSHRDDGEA
jgi:sec-independent protein translocase protein TatA